MSQEIVIEVTNSTPLLIGWYRPEVADPLGLRATEIKGLWRYWARAVVGGVLYDQGLLNGMDMGCKENIFRTVNKEEAGAISCIVGKILGLGCVCGSYSEASRFKISIEALSTIRVSRSPTSHRDLQRIGLLTIDRSIEYIDRGARFAIKIIRRRTSSNEYRDLLQLGEDLAIKILLMTLQLSGFGKGGRRGLGSLDLTNLRNLTTPRDLRDLIKDVYDSAKKIIDDPDTSRLCKDLRRLTKRSADKLPPIPVLSREAVDDNSVASIYSLHNIGFRDIHNFFLRSYRCRVLTGDPKCFDDIRKNYVGWFLGLPREQRGRGYKAGDISRRASPIYVAYHGRNNVFGGGAFVTVILSSDWPCKVSWDSITVSIDDKKIIDAYQIIWKEFGDYLSKLGVKINRVWP